MRTKNKWFKNKARSLEDQAKVLAQNCWYIAVANTKNMEQGGFYINLPDRTLNVIAEFLAFLAHISDRLVYDQLDDDDRQRFISTLCLKLNDIVQDNWHDIAKPDTQPMDFVATLNARFSDYATLPFDEPHPPFLMCRYVGDKISDVMGPEHNKFALSQVIEVETPQSIETLNKIMTQL